jgi:hypothetical protein
MVDPRNDVHHSSSGHWPEGEARTYDAEAVASMQHHHQGAVAYLEGKSLQDCPLEKHSMEAMGWEQGWEDCQTASNGPAYVERLADTLKRAETSLSEPQRVSRRTGRRGDGDVAIENEEGLSPSM